MKQKGFTLIELMVVVAIIGILVTIVLVSLNQARLKTRCSDGDSEACAELSQDAKDKIIEKKNKPKKETNLDRAKRICSGGILEFSGDPDSTYDRDFTVKCK